MNDDNTRILIGDSNNGVEIRSAESGIQTIMIWSDNHGLNLYHHEAIIAFQEYQEKRRDKNE